MTDSKEQRSPKEARALDPFSLAVKSKKERWYSRVKLSVSQMDVIVRVVAALLCIVIVLIVLEAAGIFALPFGPGQ